MNCKDCIYFKRCVVLGVELDMHCDKEADKNCRHFKNNADFAEVVRCKDCKYWHGGDCYRIELTKSNDFCSCGEKADGE